MKKKCSIQNGSGDNQNKPMAVLADPLAWQGTSYWTGQRTNNLFHPPGHSPNDTPESWDNRQSGWVLAKRGYQEILKVFLFSLVEDPLLTPEKVPLISQVCLDPWWRFSWSTRSPRRWFFGPLMI